MCTESKQISSRVCSRISLAGTATKRQNWLNYPSVNALVQTKAIMNNTIAGFLSLVLWFTDNMISFLGRCVCGKAVWRIRHWSSCPNSRVSGSSCCGLVLRYVYCHIDKRCQPKLLSFCSVAFLLFLQTRSLMSLEKVYKIFFTKSPITKSVRIIINCSLTEVQWHLKETRATVQDN